MFMSTKDIVLRQQDCAKYAHQMSRAETKAHRSCPTAPMQQIVIGWMTTLSWRHRRPTENSDQGEAHGQVTSGRKVYSRGNARATRAHSP